MKKKVLALTLAAILCVGAFAGCSSGSTDEASTTETT